MKMEVTLKIKKDYVKAILHKGKTKAHTPKSYKEVGYAGHDIGFWASQEHLTMYRNSRGEYIPILRKIRNFKLKSQKL